MDAMLTLRKGHGSALNVGTYTPSSIGRFANNPQRRLKPRKFCNRSGDGIGRVRGYKMSKLFFVNVPYNCSDRELRDWVESRGFETRSIRLVRDLVAGASPAFGYVELRDDSRTHEAIDTLNGKKMRNQTILVKEAQVHTAGAGRGMERKTA